MAANYWSKGQLPASIPQTDAVSSDEAQDQAVLINAMIWTDKITLIDQN